MWCIKDTSDIADSNTWERPAETGHRARMIYFEKNGFQYSIRVFVRKKAFRNKNNGTIGKSRKNLSI